MFVCVLGKLKQERKSYTKEPCYLNCHANETTRSLANLGDTITPHKHIQHEINTPTRGSNIRARL